MKNFTTLAVCGMMTLAALPTYAKNVDETTMEKDGVKITYWNDFKDNIQNADLNQLYPNWRVNVTGNEKFGEGTQGTVNFVYKDAQGNVIPNGEGSRNGTIGTDGTYHNYISLGVLPESGEYTVFLTLTLIPAGSTEPTVIVYDPYTFNYQKIVISGDVPQATLSWEVVNGETTSELRYKIETENVPDDATYRVWLDAPGNITQAESTDKEGVLTVNVPLGGNVTYWIKAQVTLPDGTSFPAKGNDSGVAFNSTGVRPETYTLTITNPIALSESTGTIDYEIKGDLAKAQSATMYVVTNAFGEGDVEVGRIDNVTANTGTINLTGLKADSVNELWVKLDITLEDGNALETIQYPGAAQGWTGLSVNTTGLTVLELIDANEEVEYFNLQGIKVANPENGLFIRVQGKKTSKVYVK